MYDYGLGAEYTHGELGYCFTDVSRIIYGSIVNINYTPTAIFKPEYRFGASMLPVIAESLVTSLKNEPSTACTDCLIESGEQLLVSTRTLSNAYAIESSNLLAQASEQYEGAVSRHRRCGDICKPPTEWQVLNRLFDTLAGEADVPMDSLGSWRGDKIGYLARHPESVKHVIDNDSLQSLLTKYREMRAGMKFFIKEID